MFLRDFLHKPPTPANVLATLTNSCACHVFCNASKSLRLPREKQFEPPKVLRASGVLWCFNDFGFQLDLAPQRSANFAKFNFQKCSEPSATAWCKFSAAQLAKVLRPCQFLTGSRSSATPVFGNWLCEPSKPRYYGKTWENTAFRAMPTRQNLSCLASVLYNIFAGKLQCFKTWRQRSV